MFTSLQRMGRGLKSGRRMWDAAWMVVAMPCCCLARVEGQGVDLLFYLGGTVAVMRVWYGMV